MLKFRSLPLLKIACLAGVLLLSACSPKYNWREVRGTGAPFTVMLPAKPASHARLIDLDGIAVTMTMTAAEVDGVTFAVGAAALPDTTQSQQALNAMKNGLVRNINGTIREEKSSPAGTTPITITLEASSPPTQNSQRLLLARFVAKGEHVYQVIVAGEEQAVSREEADTFFASFKPD